MKSDSISPRFGGRAQPFPTIPRRTFLPRQEAGQAGFGRISAGRRLYIGLMKALCLLSAAVTCGVALFLIGYVLVKGVPSVTWELLSTTPSYLEGTIGILPDILNTVYIISATLLIVLPLGWARPST